jgi:hypothetical protein
MLVNREFEVPAGIVCGRLKGKLDGILRGCRESTSLYLHEIAFRIIGIGAGRHVFRKAELSSDRDAI